VKQLHAIAQRRERIAQLVREHGEELVFTLVCSSELLCALVQRLFALCESRPCVGKVDSRLHRRWKSDVMLRLLQDVVEEPLLHRLGADLLASRVREHDHRNRRGALLECFEHGDAVAPPQGVVGDHCVERRVREGGCERALVVHFDRLQPGELAFENAERERPIVRVVVDDQQPQRTRHA
jgi:hypothetical protein